MGPAEGRAASRPGFPSSQSNCGVRRTAGIDPGEGSEPAWQGQRPPTCRRVSNTEPTPAQVGHRRSLKETLPPREAAGGGEGWGGSVATGDIKEAKARAEQGCAAG